LKHLLRVPRADAAVLNANNHYFRSLIQAVGLGVALASILFMKRQVTQGIIIESVENLKDEKPWQDELPSMMSIKIKC
jgi:SulP family sulfate permease